MTDPIDEYIAGLNAGSTTNTWVKVWRPEYNQYWYVDRMTGQYMQPAEPVEASAAPKQPPAPSISTSARLLPNYNPDASLNGYEWLENPNYVPPGGSGPNTLNTNTSDRYILTRMPDGSLKQEPNPNYVPPREPQAPLGRQLTPAELQLQQLNVLKAERELQNPLVLAQQQMNEAIGSIQQQIASGQIDPAEGERLISVARANLSSSLQGTTPWQMEQAKQQAKQQQTTLASNVLSDQLNVGSNMAQGLLSGAGGIFGKILQSSAPPTNFNPLDMAKGFVGEMGGGPEMSQLARSILMGALQQGQGGW